MESKKSGMPPKVTIKKIIHAKRERVFDAWTKPEIMKHWFVGKKGVANVTNDLRVGGNYRNEMLLEDGGCEKDSQDDKGVKSFMHHGEYLEIIPPEKLVFTWNSHAVKNTVVTVELKDLGSETEVTLTHELSAEEDRSGHTEGWTFALNGLASLLG